jgi:HD superfamily phosphohydrolase YqeK
MTTRPALEKLALFNEHPSEEHASALIDIPVLYDLLQHEQSMLHGYSHSALAMCRWIHMRGSEILRTLTVHDLPPKDFHEESISWAKVVYLSI